jgi:hypothetical protein
MRLFWRGSRRLHPVNVGHGRVHVASGLPWRLVR